MTLPTIRLYPQFRFDEILTVVLDVIWEHSEMFILHSLVGCLSFVKRNNSNKILVPQLQRPNEILNDQLPATVENR